MTSKLVWAAGIAGFFAFGLAAGAVIPSPILALVLLVPLVLGGSALGLVVGMKPRRHSPGTRLARAKLFGAFLVASLAGALLGLFLPVGVTAWLPIGLLGVALLAITFKFGSAPRPEEAE
jgi:hypothetical protein